MPDKAEVVKLYTGDKPIFTKHNVEDQIERIYKRTVQLKSGGSISIDQTEALTAIDVNSARSTRSASSEDTAARTNLEAAEEIARQLRLRDIGGLIVIDFIDMESSKHIRQVERAFADAMSRDKARYDVTRISKLGLLEVSRQRLKSTKASSSFMECPTCQGDGTIRTPEAAARAAFRKIQARVVRDDISGVKVFLPPEVALYLLNQKRDDLTRLEQRYKVAIEAVPEARLKASQFEIEEVRREETEIAPVVTADTVDEALAAGSLQPPARPAAEPQEAAPPKEAPQEAAEPVVKGRRRRRRRRGRDTGVLPGTEPAARADDSTELPSTPATAGRASGAHAETRGEEQDEPPAFSEGPEADDAHAPGSIAATAIAGPLLPRLSEIPGAAGVVQGAHRRRRRRRRRRGRGGGMGLQDVASSRPPARGSGAWAVQDARRNEARQAPTHGPVSAPGPAPVTPSVYSGPPAEPARPSPPSDLAVAEGPSQAPGEPKPKRRWWRRSFSRG